jgi:hypothetical protein
MRIHPRSNREKAALYWNRKTITDKEIGHNKPDKT